MADRRDAAAAALVARLLGRATLPAAPPPWPGRPTRLHRPLHAPPRPRRRLDDGLHRCARRPEAARGLSRRVRGEAGAALLLPALQRLLLFRRRPPARLHVEQRQGARPGRARRRLCRRWRAPRRQHQVCAARGPTPQPHAPPLWPHAPAPRPARGGPAATELAPPRRPCLLVDHPEYAACAAAALFVGASGAASAAAAGAPPSSGAVFWPSTPSAAAYSPERSMFWDADGAPRAMRAARSARARTCVSDLSPAWPALRLAPRLYEPGRRRVVARPRGRGAAAARHRRHLE